MRTNPSARRHQVLALAAALALTVMPALAGQTPALAARTASIAAPSKVLPNADFSVSGALRTAVVRPVKVQVRSAGAWRTVATITSDTGGSYKAKTSLAKTSVLRAVAPPAVVDGTSLPSLISPARTVQVIKQKLKLNISAPKVVVNQAVLATFSTSSLQAGRPVDLQIRRAGHWVSVDHGKLSDVDDYDLTLQNVSTAAGTSHYRAYLPTWGRVPAVASAAVKVTTKPTATLKAAAVAVGGNFACALATSGTVRCWGENDFGALGNGTYREAALPTRTAGPTGVIAISTGFAHACELTAAGRAYCWGDNEHGQLGDGTTTNRPRPVQVEGLPGGVTAISAGAFTTCALSGGDVWCWGSNSTGSVGDATTVSRSEPVKVKGLTSVAQVSAGITSCARTNDGSVWCWGDNRGGSLGNGTSIDNSPVPVQVSGLSQATWIDSGSDLDGFPVCAVTDGQVWCWGEKATYADEKDSSVPVKWPLGPGITAVSTDDNFVCALTSGGAVSCRSDPGYPSVLGLTGATGVRVSGGLGCATLASGGIKCWGAGDPGNGGLYFDVPMSVVGFG